MKPLNEWLIVETVKRDEKSAGGIIFVEEQKMLILKATVKEISPDIYRACHKDEKELGYEVGDVILHHHQVGIQVDPNDPTDGLLFIRYEDVMGKVDYDGSD